MNNPFLTELTNKLAELEQLHQVQMNEKQQEIDNLTNIITLKDSTIQQLQTQLTTTNKPAQSYKTTIDELTSKASEWQSLLTMHDNQRQALQTQANNLHAQLQQANINIARLRQQLQVAEQALNSQEQAYKTQLMNFKTNLQTTLQQKLTALEKELSAQLSTQFKDSQSTSDQLKMLLQKLATELGLSKTSF